MTIRVRLWIKIVKLYPWFLRRFYKMDIGKDVMISWNAHLDKSINPLGIHIGEGTVVLRDAMILSHDACRRLKADIYIGKNCTSTLDYTSWSQDWRFLHYCSWQCCHKRCPL